MKKTLPLILATIAALALSVAAPALATKPDNGGAHKVWVCHATAGLGELKNGYDLIEVDIASTQGEAHLAHATTDPKKNSKFGTLFDYIDVDPKNLPGKCAPLKDEETTTTVDDHDECEGDDEGDDHEGEHCEVTTTTEAPTTTVPVTDPPTTTTEAPTTTVPTTETPLPTVPPTDPSTSTTTPTVTDPSTTVPTTETPLPTVTPTTAAPGLPITGSSPTQNLLIGLGALIVGAALAIFFRRPVA